jgi:membrane fusion protein, multidrug efflux system
MLMKRIFLFVSVFILLAMLVGGLGYLQFTAKPGLIRAYLAAHAPPPTTVAIGEARRETWAPRLSAIGSFHAYQGIDVAPQLGGVLTAIHVVSGEDVAKDAPLFDVDTSVEAADLKNNLAVLKNADLTLERQKTLVTGGNTTKASADSAEAARDTAAASVERVRAVIAQKHIVAPFAGRLGIRKVDLGQYVSPGTSLITLQQLHPIFVDFPVPEQSLAVLRPGQKVEVKVAAYPDPFVGKIETIDARVGQDTRNVLIRAAFENKDLRLLPGMFADVVVMAGEPVSVVTVPRTAISVSLYGDSVFVLEPAPVPAGAPQATGAAQAADIPQTAPKADDIVYRVQRRFVRTGDTRDDRMAILEGVQPGEKVVSEGQLKLQSGERVRVDPEARLVPQAIMPRE